MSTQTPSRPADARAWYRPETLEEALQLRSRERVVPMAGATDLYVRHRRGNGLPPSFDYPILSLGHLAELRAIEVGDDRIVIGAAAPYTDVLLEPAVPDVLRASIREIAAPALRNVGTIGGNICNASPAADAVAPLYALGARCRLRSAAGNRELPIEELITGPGRTTLADDELLTAVVVPRTHGAVWLYRKVGTRRANALSKLSIAAWASVNRERVSGVGIALGAVAPTVVRRRDIETRMLGRRAELSARRDEILAAYRESVSPIDDQRSSADYRREVAVNLVRQFLEQRVFAGADAGSELM
jgi:CO/xanthine dehydrogenase FAD-binding subunit